ncbi:MAG: YncE family protein [Caulobacteraceae bacterium]
MRASALSLCLALFAGGAFAGAPAEITPTGAALTPTAAEGSIFQPLNPHLAGLPDVTAGQAAAMAISPDGKTLLVLTSGFNRNFGPDGRIIAALSSEYVFIFDLAGASPVQRQVIAVPNTFLGLAWAPLGRRFYVSGGVDDDVLEYVGGRGGFALSRTFGLGHKAGVGLAVQPEAGALAASPGGDRLLVANFQNDSVSLIDIAAGRVAAEQDLRPGLIDRSARGRPGGSFPRAVLWLSPTRAYVASERDRELITLDISGDALRPAARLALPGQPVAMTADRSGRRLFVAMDDTDSVAVVDVNTGRIAEEIPTAAPKRLLGVPRLGGAGSNGVALSADGKTLLVSNGGENAVAVIRLGPPSEVVGLIPTGWYPTAVAIARDGTRFFVINGKSIAGPSPLACRRTLAIAGPERTACAASGQYVWQLEKAGLLSLPPPDRARLARLTAQVTVNDHLGGATLSPREAAIMAFLRARIGHVIYIVKENRTYDQVLGDLEVGDGDPSLAIFGRRLTPNQHALARQFVDLDRFFDSGESSNTGWNWTTAARTNDFTEREAPVNYADRGLQYDQEGDNRNLNVGYASSRERVAANPASPADPDVLPGARDVAAPDGPDGEEGRGYIWDAALRAGLWVRNWGFYGDLVRESPKMGAAIIPLAREPWKSGLRVFYPDKPALMAISDPYFRGFDQAFPDFWRVKEWERELKVFSAAGKAPALMLVRISHDHTGDFDRAIDKVNTVETEVADNDYALGLIVQTVAASPFAKDTLIFVVEDDAQDGPDHIDAHRSLALVAGPFVKHGAVVAERYTSVSLMRTIEMVLGLPPMGLNDAEASPMTAVFDEEAADWSFMASVPEVLRATSLPLPPTRLGETHGACPTRSAAYWTAAMAGEDFNREDRLDTPRFNLALWRGMRGEAPYPVAREGRDLSKDRAALLSRAASMGHCGASTASDVAQRSSR